MLITFVDKQENSAYGLDMKGHDNGFLSSTYPGRASESQVSQEHNYYPAAKIVELR